MWLVSLWSLKTESKEGPVERGSRVVPREPCPLFRPLLLMGVTTYGQAANASMSWIGWNARPWGLV
jgi:hypothetical protein